MRWCRQAWIGSILWWPSGERCDGPMPAASIVTTDHERTGKTATRLEEKG